MTMETTALWLLALRHARWPLTSVLCVTLAQAGLAQRVASSPDSAQLARDVDALFSAYDKPDVPGCAVAAIRGGQILYARGYGVADLEHHVPINASTRFYVASVSKQFTAFSIAL